MKPYQYLCLFFYIFLTGCANSLFYFPNRVDYEPYYKQPVAHEDVWISQKSSKLHAWFLKAQGEPKATVIFLHGNAQNLTAHVLAVDWLPAAGFNVLIVDYRGYGLSPGKPTRQGVLDDALSAWQYARTRADVNPDKMILMGQSLGAANALVLAGKVHLPGLRAVLADSAFSSYGRIAREKMREVSFLGYLLWPFSPLLVSDELSPEDYIADIAPTPLLLIHGEEDKVVPFSHGLILQKKAKMPVEFLALPHTGHTESLSTRRAEVMPKIVDFFNRALP